jgi:hypothetical protein
LMRHYTGWSHGHHGHGHCCGHAHHGWLRACSHFLHGCADHAANADITIEAVLGERRIAAYEIVNDSHCDVSVTPELGPLRNVCTGEVVAPGAVEITPGSGVALAPCERASFRIRVDTETLAACGTYQAEVRFKGTCCTATIEIRLTPPAPAICAPGLSNAASDESRRRSGRDNYARARAAAPLPAATSVARRESPKGSGRLHGKTVPAQALGFVQYCMEASLQHTLPPPKRSQSAAALHSRYRPPSLQSASRRHSQGALHPGNVQQTAAPPDWLHWSSATQIEPTGCPLLPPVAVDVPPVLEAVPPVLGAVPPVPGDPPR